MFYIKDQQVRDKSFFSLIIGILIAALFFAGCDGCGKKTVRDIKNTKKNNTTLTQASKKIILLLHGMNCPRDIGIKALGNKLGSDIQGSTIIILDRENSAQTATTTQAEEAYADLRKKMEEQQLSSDTPIVIIGDSHGGVLVLELYRLHKKDLNITGIITNHSPLEGAPGANADVQNIENFKNILKNILLQNPQFTMFESMIDSLNLEQILGGNMGPAVKADLKHGSTLLQNISTTLATIDIPVLALGGKINTKEGLLVLIDFAGLGPIRSMLVPMVSDPSTIHKIKPIFNSIIGDEENDAFIPLYSQLGQHIPDNKNVIKKSGDGYHHFYGMINHSAVYKEIKEFTANSLKAKK